VDGAAQLVRRHEDVRLAFLLLLGDHEAGAPSGRVKSADNEVDLLGQRVPLALDPVDAALLRQPRQLLEA
jgi:hypothetical protein